MKRISLSTLTIAMAIVCHAESKYVMHSSQLVLASGDNQRAQILNANDSRVKKLRMVEHADGTVNFAYDRPGSTTLYLSKEGSWNATFLPDSTSAVALWTVEKAGTNAYVKIKCKENSRYLGTDNTTSGSNVFCDKQGDDAKYLWYLADKTSETIGIDTATYIVNPAVRRQAIEGWGVSLCWWARMCGGWSDKKIDQLVDWLVSPTGLNFNIFRYNIGGGDDPQNANCTPHHMGNGKGLRAEMEGFQDERNGPFIWSRDEGQRKIMLKIKEKRPDAIFEAFSNSCPWWMTYSGCCSGSVDGGSDNLRPEYYKDFANYLVEVCKHYKEEYGIEFRTLEPFNESMTGFWYANGVQEGCHFDVKSQIAFIKVLHPILKASGLNTVISASDETAVYLGIDAFKQYKSAGIMNLLGQWNTHTYTADDNSRAKIGSLSRSIGMRQWMSEVGSGGNGLQGNLNMAQRLMDDVRYMLPDAWIDWQYVEEKNDQWCMVQAQFNNESTATRVKNYYVRQHFSRFIPAGYRFVTSMNRSTLCAMSPDESQLVLVCLNTQPVKAVHRANLRFCEADASKIKGYVTSESSSLGSFRSFKMADDQTLTITLPALSIVTLTIPVSNVVELGNGQMASKVVIVPQTNDMLALTGTEKRVSVEQMRGDDSQIWDLIDNGNKTYSFKNQNGLMLTYSSSNYALSARSKTNSFQAFALQPVDDYFHRIKASRITKYLDLENGNSSSGTGVGVYAYNDATDVTRHWMIVGIDAAEEDDPDALSESQDTEKNTIAAVYDIQGRRLPQNSTQKGIHIIKMKDGRTIKTKR